MAEAVTQCLFNTTDIFNGVGDYAYKVEVIHRVLGAFIVITIFVWGLHIAQFTPRQPTLYAVGGLYCAASVYLFISVLVGFNAHALGALWTFVWRDIAQIQHITIAVSLLAVGLCDIIMARYAINAFVWHFVWFCCNSSIGFVFIVHPERDWLQTITHQVLGFALVMGAIALMFIKISDRYGNELWLQAVAAVSYLVAALIMLHIYHERRDMEYVATDFRCAPAAVLTFFFLTISSLTVCGATYGFITRCCCRTASAPSGGVLRRSASDSDGPDGGSSVADRCCRHCDPITTNASRGGGLGGTIADDPSTFCCCLKWNPHRRSSGEPAYVCVEWCAPCTIDCWCACFEIGSRRLHRAMCCCCSHVFEPRAESIWNSQSASARYQRAANGSGSIDSGGGGGPGLGGRPLTRSNSMSRNSASTGGTAIEYDEKEPVVLAAAGMATEGMTEQEMINLRNNLFTV